MSVLLVILLASLGNVLPVLSFCDEECEDSPVFTPARVVVKHGDPVSATCYACQTECLGSLKGLEKSVGDVHENGTTFSWTVNSMTEWSMSATCFYNEVQNPDHQCCSHLPVTVYKIPDNVSIGLVRHTGPMLEGHNFILECAVHEVAPIENLIVTFYRGQTPISETLLHNETDKMPLNRTFPLNITASSDEDGVSYYCEAKLDFGMAEPRPMVQSPIFTAEVHYKPQFKDSSNPDPIEVTKEESMQLTCSAVGNPSPSYTWTHSSRELSQDTSSVLTIKSATSSDGGQYTCTAKNIIGTVTKTFTVKVHANNTIYIVIGVILLVVVLIAVCGLIYLKHYRKNRMGKYNLMNILRRSVV